MFRLLSNTMLIVFARPPVALLAIMVFGLPSVAHAQPYIISAGNASFTITQGQAASIFTFDAYFDATRTRAQVLSDSAPGNAQFTINGNTASLSDSIRPFGVAPLNDAGGTTPGVPGQSRTRQATSLTIDLLSTNSVLSSWSPSNDSFGFTGNTTLGEQIAFTSMQRWTGPFTGSLLYGDFALRYTGSRLILTSNIDFLHAEFAEIGNPNVSVNGSTLTISGDLLVGEGLYLLDSSAPLGADFGNFTLTATLVPVPEPTSIGLITVAALGAMSWTIRATGVKPTPQNAKVPSSV